MNNHTDTRVTDYALGELDEEARLEMQSHLASDPEASRAAAEIEMLGGLLRAALPQTVARTAVGVVEPTTNRPHRPAALWALAASIAVLVTSIGGVKWWRQPGDVQVAVLHVAAAPSQSQQADGAKQVTRGLSEKITLPLEGNVTPPTREKVVAGALALPATPLGDLAGVITPQISMPQGLGPVANPSTPLSVDIGAVNVFTQGGASFAVAAPQGTLGDIPSLHFGYGNEGFAKTGNGTLMLGSGGATTGQGAFSAFGGTLDAGNGGSAGSIAGNIVNNGALNDYAVISGTTASPVIAGSGTAGTYGPVVSGASTYGGIASVSSGHVVRDTNSYTGGVTIGSGTAIVGLSTTLPAIANPEPQTGVTFQNAQGFDAYRKSSDPSNAVSFANTLYPIVQEYEQLTAQYGPQHPRVKELALKLTIIHQQFDASQWNRAVEPPQHNTEAYDQIVENAFLKPSDAPLSTFSIDVDTASYSNVRRMLNAGQLPPRGAVRIEEFINYFTYDYPQPTGDDPFAVTTEAAHCPWNGDHVLVRIGLKGKEIHRKERPATNLVFLVDVSGSMADANKLPLVRESLKLLVKELGDSDRVAIVVYAGSTGLVLPSTGGDRKQTILDAIDRLSSGGSTNGGAGITLAYKTAVDNFIEGGVNRVVLATDGDFNVGVTNQDELVRLIEAKAKSGVFFSALGYGMGNLKDSTLEKLADKGNGNYAYIDTLAEARKVLVEQMSGTLVTIAKDVKIQVEFNPARVAAYRLLGYENRVLAAQDFNDDKKDAGEIGAGHTVTALYELIPAVARRETQSLPTVDPLKYQRPPQAAALTGAAEAAELLTLKLRYKQPDGDVSKLIERPLADEVLPYGRTTADFRFAAAVASFGMVLRQSQYRGSATFDSVQELGQEGVGYDPHGYRAEFIELTRKARVISSQRVQSR